MKLYEPAPPARKDELANVQDGIAVIVDGDTCPVIVGSGMYAYIKNNTHGLAEGLYKNTSNNAFPTSGGTADGTVFEADSTGGLNALNASLKLFTKNFPENKTVPTSGSTTGEIDIQVNGYTPIGIITFNSNYDVVIPFRIDISSDKTKLKYGLKNFYGSPLTFEGSFTVLYTHV